MKALTHLHVSKLLLYIYLLATGSLILPFGSAYGDTFLPPVLDTSSSAINFSNPFPFLGTNETSIYVSSNNSYNSWILIYSYR